MNRKALFLGKAVGIAILAFVLWPLFSRVYLGVVGSAASFVRVSFGFEPVDVFKERFSLFLIPALALIWGSTEEYRRKLVFSAVGTAVLLSLDVINLSTGLQAVASGGGQYGSSAVSSIAIVVYHSYGWLIPLTTIFLFTGGDAAMLWEPKKVLKTNRCPICGEIKTGMADHIKDVHGGKHLRTRRVKRALSIKG
ncbi:MAG: hypothetical protein ACYC1U_06705 [Candidatus Aquicultorales bacterium]